MARATRYEEEKEMVVTRKVLLISLGIVIGLFVIANPLGDSHHALGAHHKWAADLGQTFFLMSVIGAVLWLVLALVGLLQYAMRSRRVRS